MRIQLSDHFDYKKLLRFVMPSIIMMIFTSVYGVIDGFFVSNFAGKTSFAAINLIMPVLMILGTLGFMIGAGGSAIVAKTLGEGRTQTAKQYFSMLIYVTIAGGIFFTILGETLLRPITVLLGATDNMVDNCVLYGRIILITLTPFMLQNVFQSFLITAEKPKFGLAVTVAAGCTNIVLDFLFVGIFKWGLIGAASATAISQLIGGIIPLVYFLRPNNSTLSLTRAKLDKKILIKTCTNGSSELMTNISMSLVNILYNFQLMKFAGENGIAAYGVIMYTAFIFVTVFIGYSIGSAPIIGFHYGAQNSSELKNLFRRSLVIISVSGIFMTTLALLLAMPLSLIFVGYDETLFNMTTRGFMMYSSSFIICGINIFASSFFTALNNGGVSAVISFLRTLVFQIIAVLVLPLILGLDGIWLSILLAEIMALIVAITCFVVFRKKYNYT